MFVRRRLKILSKRLLMKKPQLEVFETEVGVKYRNGSFNSKQFSELVESEGFLSDYKIQFSDLILTPDLLLNRHTFGVSEIAKSPHFRLMQEIVSDTLSETSEYVELSRSGRLDPRSPCAVEIDRLIKTYAERKEELKQVGFFAIHVLKVVIDGEVKYIILDGKHRAAMLAHLNQPQSLYLRITSGTYAQHPFFHKVYSYMLSRDPGEYSINQKIIRAILNER